MSALLKWYISRLKTHPMVTNVGSALVLMTTGDLMAQEIELHNLVEYFSAESTSSKEEGGHHAAQRFATSVTTEQQANHPKLSFRRYGTLSPIMKERRNTKMLEEERKAKMEQEAKEDYNESKEEAFLFPDMQESLRILARKSYTELASLDYFRTGTMAFWGGLTTPAFITLYRVFDRYLPRTVTPASVLPRVVLTFLFSVPVNAIFFCYGSFVQHTAQYYSLVQEWQAEMRQLGFRDISLSEVVKDVPFDQEMAWSTARLKLESEFRQTIITSGSIWIPINIVNFSLVPPHLRPLVLMLCSTFWNCYLSLAQHRDVELEQTQPDLPNDTTRASLSSSV
jgi:hypothetical protein